MLIALCADCAAPEERIEWQVMDIPLMALSLAVSAGYAYTRSWVLSNILGACFSLSAIEQISLSSFQVGCILLVRRTCPPGARRALAVAVAPS